MKRAALSLAAAASTCSAGSTRQVSEYQVACDGKPEQDPNGR